MTKHISLVFFSLLISLSCFISCTNSEDTVNIGPNIAGIWALQSSSPDDGLLTALDATFTEGVGTGGTAAISINGGTIQNTTYALSGKTLVTNAKVGGKDLIITFENVNFSDNNTMTFLLSLPPAPNKPVTEYEVTLLRQ